MIRILIVDDHPLIREGLKKVFKVEPDLEVVGDLARGTDATDFILHHACDIVILDLNLPDRTGLDVLKDIIALKPGIKTLILSIFPEELFAIRAIRAGAAGYITKDSVPEELVKAVRRVMTGRRYISAELAEQLAIELTGSLSEPLYKKLSDREFQTLLLLGSGKTTSQVSSLLSICTSTVNTYKARIFEKMHFSSLSDLIRYVISHDLL